MSDYIKRDDAIEAFDPRQRRDWYTPWIVETLNDLPPADVAPVRHGRAIYKDDGNWYCETCGRQIPDLHEYCNHCGVKIGY